MAIDPGRQKCGLAIVDLRRGVLARGVIPTETLTPVVKEWTALHQPEVLVVGGGTALKTIRAALAGISVPQEVFPEAHTTLRARKRYFKEHPRQGWRRWVPLSLQTPPVPVDDYAAVLIAEDYLKQVSPLVRRRMKSARKKAS